MHVALCPFTEAIPYIAKLFGFAIPLDLPHHHRLYTVAAAVQSLYSPTRGAVQHCQPRQVLPQAYA